MQPTKLPTGVANGLAAGKGPVEGQVGSEAFGARLREVIETATGKPISDQQLRSLLAGKGDDAPVSRDQVLALLAGRPSEANPLDAEALTNQLAQLKGDADAEPGDAASGTDIEAWFAAVVEARGADVGNGGTGVLATASSLEGGSQGLHPSLPQAASGLAFAASSHSGASQRASLEALLNIAEQAAQARNTGSGGAPRGADAAAGSPNLDFEGLVSGANARTATPHAAPPTLQLTAPVGEPGFTRGVAEQITWMVGSDIQTAKVTLDPPDLGPLQIAVTTQDDHTSVSIAAHHGATRDALMADSARLRAMLVDNGFADAEVTVHEGSAEGSDTPGFGAGGNGSQADGGHDMAGSGEPVPARSGEGYGGSGLVDHYV